MMETQATWESGGDLSRGIQSECQEFGHEFEGRWRGSADWDGEIQTRDCKHFNCDISEVRWKP